MPEEPLTATKARTTSGARVAVIGAVLVAVGIGGFLGYRALVGIPNIELDEDAIQGAIRPELLSTTTIRTSADFAEQEAYEGKVGLEYDLPLTNETIHETAKGVSFNAEEETLTFDHWNSIAMDPPDSVDAGPDASFFDVCPSTLTDPSGEQVVDELALYDYHPSGTSLEDDFYYKQNFFEVDRDSAEFNENRSLTLDMSANNEKPDLHWSYTAAKAEKTGALPSIRLKVAYFFENAFVDVDGFDPDTPETYIKPAIRPTWYIEDPDIALFRPTVDGPSDEVEIFPLKEGTTRIVAEACGKHLSREVVVQRETFVEENHEQGRFEVGHAFQTAIAKPDLRGLSGGFDIDAPEELTDMFETIQEDEISFELELTLDEIQDAWSYADQGDVVPAIHEAYITLDGGNTWQMSDVQYQNVRDSGTLAAQVEADRLTLSGTVQKPDNVPEEGFDVRIRVYADYFPYRYQQLPHDAVAEDGLASTPVEATLNTIPTFSGTVCGAANDQPCDAGSVVHSSPFYFLPGDQNRNDSFKTFSTSVRDRETVIYNAPYLRVPSLSDDRTIVVHGLWTFGREERAGFTPPLVDNGDARLSSSFSVPPRYYAFVDNEGLGDVPCVPYRDDVDGDSWGSRSCNTLQLFSFYFDPRQQPYLDHVTNNRQGEHLLFESPDIGGHSESCEIGGYGRTVGYDEDTYDHPLLSDDVRVSCESVQYTGADESPAYIGTVVTTYNDQVTFPIDGQVQGNGFRSGGPQDFVFGDTADLNTVYALPDASLKYSDATLRLIIDEENLPARFREPIQPPDQEPLPGDNEPDVSDEIIDRLMEGYEQTYTLDSEVMHRGAKRAVVRFDDPRPAAELEEEELVFSYGLVPTDLSTEEPLADEEVVGDGSEEAAAADAAAAEAAEAAEAAAEAAADAAAAAEEAENAVDPAVAEAAAVVAEEAADVARQEANAAEADAAALENLAFALRRAANDAAQAAALLQEEADRLHDIYNNNQNDANRAFYQQAQSIADNAARDADELLAFADAAEVDRDEARQDAENAVLDAEDAENNASHARAAADAAAADAAADDNEEEAEEEEQPAADEEEAAAAAEEEAADVDEEEAAADEESDDTVTLDKTAQIYEDAEGMYVVLEDLEGGGFDEDDTGVFIDGKVKYLFRVTSSDQYSSQIQQLESLNRRQTVLYTYGLVFGDTYSPGFEQEIVDKEAYKAIRGGGPEFFYKPPTGDPLSLPGVKFAIMNDPLFKEFDIRLFFTQSQESVSYSVEQLYRVIHDRIYKEDLALITDPEGLAYWTEQVEREDADRINLAGAKFAVFNSDEYRAEVTKVSSDPSLANAELAYQYVFRRGADIEGRNNLAGQAETLDAMRSALAQSDEFDTRLADIEEEQGRRTAINEIYESVFGRAADIEGLDYWSGEQKEMTVLEIRDSFLAGE